MARRVGLASVAALAYLAVAAAQAWPLPLALNSTLTGPPSGDTGVYVWNTWVFRQELLERTSPFFTSTIFSADTRADLSLHNYTPVANALAYPLQPLTGVVAAFNLVYLVNVALAGVGLFLLARRLTGRTLEAWVAGALFAASPFLVARSTAHFSLVSAAPLPIFLWSLLRAWETRRVRDAVVTGAVLAWAAYSDPYYAVYALTLAAGFLATRVATIRRGPPTPAVARAGRLLTGAFIAVAAVVLAVRALGPGAIELGPLRVSMQSLYTPVLVLTLLAALRAVAAWRPRLAWRADSTWRAADVLRLGGAAALTAAVLLAPVLAALAERLGDDRLVRAPVLWRSSAPGVDLAAALLPNPHHPLMPQAARDWLATLPGGLVEQVVSLPVTGLLLVVLAWRAAGFRPPRFWVAIAAGGLWLALGPFVHVAGVNTHVPTPWTFLRYLPVLGDARMPARFGVLAAMGLAVLVALALAALGRRFPARRPLLVAVAAAALAAELVAAPRALHPAVVPAIYDRVAADPRPVAVLDLPYGIRDGLSSLGDFSAASQFYQTHHGKPLVGGYLSRVSERRKNFARRRPVLGTLLALSEGRRVSPHQLEHARDAAPFFVARVRLGYVTMDLARTPAELRRAAIDLLDLVLVEASGTHELYVPRGAPGGDAPADDTAAAGAAGPPAL